MSFPIYNTEKSHELFKRATHVIPSGVYGHLGPAEGLFIPVDKWPMFSTKSQGTYTWDVDGNKYIDYMCAYGPNILGYCDPDVDAAAAKQTELGNCTTTPSEVMVECAEVLCDTVACADWAFFAKNGNDATQGAMMCARAHTGKKKILFFKAYYHGVSPWQAKVDYPGVTEEDVCNNIIIPWNDIPALEKTIAENKDEIAALIAQPYDHGNFHDNAFPVEGFWPQVREICTKHGIVLIVDDVRAGFRLDLAGSDHFFGFKADMICFCKALANGYNMSAICGQEFLKGSMSALSYTGSYWLSAVPFAACIANMKKMKELDTPKMFKEKGEYLTNGLKEAAKAEGIDLVVSGAPSLFYLRIANDDSLLMHQEWVAEMVSRGIFITSHHNHFINAAMTYEDFDYTIEVAKECFAIVAKNNPSKLIKF